jgi:hypothetical protein
VHTTSAVAGKSTRASLLSAAAADVPSTAAKSARRAPGSSTVTGAWPPRREGVFVLLFRSSSLSLNLHWPHTAWRWLLILWKVS